MSSNDLEKFRNEWKRELKEETKADPSQLGSPSQPLSSQGYEINNQSDSGTGKISKCSQCNIHPAFRENDKCHTCHFINRENNEHKTSTKFYPFRIVDNLLNSHESFQEENVCSNERQHSTEKSFQRSKKRKVDALEKQIVKDIFSKKLRHHEKNIEKTRYLDLFIADLDEINEIPFFDLTVPREVAIKIFEPLGIKDLCRCSQVSKSWKSLADDELLWCHICHELGYEREAQAVEKTKWKAVVRQHVEHERKLVYNWKNRIASFSQLQHIPGGILCAVDSSGDNIVSGYTNGEVKLWNVGEQYDCLFQPSNTSLIINEAIEDGTIPNKVTHMAVSPKFVVAAYRQGNVDIWKIEGKDSISPAQVIDCHDRRGLKGVEVAQNEDLVLTVSGPHDISFVHICQGFNEDGFSKKKVINIPERTVSAKIFEEQKSYSKPYIIIGTDFKINIHKTDDSQYGSDIFNHMINIHHLIGSPVTCMNARSSPSQLAVGLGSCGGAIDPYRVKVYDLNSGKLLSTLYNHTWTITCINLADSPENLMVTGCGDRRVRTFDMRTESMTNQFAGHSSQVNTVQMDDMKVVSGGDDGFVRVWDLRMSKKLWEIHNRHPVKHCHFTKNKLIVGNVPNSTMPIVDEFDSATHRRYRGTVQVYDFSVDQMTQGVPDICLSTYDEPEASHYNISLAMPYDKL